VDRFLFSFSMCREDEEEEMNDFQFGLHSKI
jgi:hypothetical protein